MAERSAVDYACRVTPMQEGMLFESLASVSVDGGTPYVSVLRFRAPRTVELNTLRRRWKHLVRNHAVLRTSFRRDKDGVFWQAALRDRQVPFTITDLSGETPVAREEGVLRRATALARAGMNPERDVLCRMDLFDRGDEGYDLLLTFHHAILDGWSVRILLDALFAEATETATPDAPRPSFAAYVHWLHRRDRAADQAWWRDYLGGIDPATPALPGQLRDDGVPLRRDYACRLENFAGLTDAARALGTTRARLLQAAWAALLSRYNRADSLFGLIVSGRAGGYAGAENLVGMCVNTIPVKADWGIGQSFAQWFHRWSADLAAAERHGFLGLADMQRLVQPGVVLAPHLVVVDPQQETAVRMVDSHGGLAADFIAGFSLGSVGATVEFSFNANRHPPDSVRDIARHFRTLLEAVIANRDVCPDDVAIPDAEERQEILVEFNPPATAGGAAKRNAEATVVSCWRKAAGAHPDAFALAFAGTRMTYKELEHKVDVLAASLVAAGVGRETPVAIAMRRSDRQFVAALAVMVAGGAYVPVDPEWPASRIDDILRDVRPAFILDDAAYDALSASASLNAVPPSFPLPSPDDAAYIIMTSGSTGVPKGVVVEHRALAHFCFWSKDRYGWRPGDIAAEHAAFTFDAAVAMAWPPLMFGAGVHILPEDARRDPVPLHGYLVAHGVTHVDLPTLLAEEFMMRYGADRAPPRLRFMSTGGEPLRRYVPSSYVLVNEYGPTECAVTCAAHTVSEAVGAIPIGKPLPGLRAYVVDTDGNPCPVGVYGELCFSGPQLARGYLNRPELTRDKFRDNPFHRPDAEDAVHARLYRTGDRARWLRRDGIRGDGVLDIAGRMDSQVKVRGHRIELGEIEAAAAAYPGVVRSAATVRTGASGERTLCLYLTLNGETDVEPFRTYLAGLLPAHAMPGTIQVVDALPLIANGKVDYARLPAPDCAVHRGHHPPSRAAEEAVAAVVADLVLADAVSMDDSFLAVGGDSIRAIRLAARLEQAGWLVSVRDIMTAPDLAALARALRPSGHTVPAPSAAAHPAPDAETARRIAEALGSGAEIFPATATQRMLLMHHAMDGSSSYAITARWRMARIDEKEFAARVQTLFDRHGMLSAAFFRDELGKEWLGIPARRPARYRFTDVSGQTVTNRMGEPDAGAERDDQGLDPFSDPLFSITVVRHAADSHELVMRYHHAILDGWSIGILLNELFSPERPVGTPPGFSAYSAWLESGGPGAAAADVSWWETALQGATPAPEPPGRRRESAGPPIHATVTVLDAGAADRCGRAAAAITVTPAAYFLTLWGILLSRCDESDTDPYFGVVVSGRPPLPGMENLVGMCAQVVPLRLPLDRADNNIAFASLAMAVQQNLQDAMEHRLVPPALVRTLPRHLFAFDNTAAVAADTVLPEPVESRGDDGYDLVLAFSEAGTGYFRYNAAAYDPAWIRVAAGHFATLAAAAAENPDAAAAELPMASADEMHRVTNSFARGPALPQGDTVVRRFRAAALRAPHSPAITFENTTITYGTLDARSDALAGTLAKAGAGKGMVVAAALPRSPEAGIAFLAILKAGAIYLPLDPAWPTARMDEILDDAGAAIIVAPAGLTIHHHAVRIDPFSAGDSAPAPPSPIAPEKRDAAYLLYTSGTTGRPKGAILDHAALAALVAWTAEELGVDAADRILHYIAFTFDPSVWLFASAFSLGASLHIAGDNLRLEPDAIVRYINDCSLTTAVFPARIAGGIVARGTDMPTLRLLCMGGETPGRIPPCPFRVLNLYGPTEACVNATFAPLHPDRSERIIGRPVANMRAYVVLDSGRPAPIGVAGELVLSGPQLARGYHNRPDETAAAFRPNPFVTGPEGDGDYARIYRTGDRVRWLPDGNLEYLGRRDGQVKVRGQRVEVGEIETVLARTDGVGEARVIPASDPAGGTRLDAFYIADGDPAAAPDEILRRLATLLPSHMIPATLTRVEAWPLTANGKLDPARLPRPEPARRDVAGGPPLTRAERDVARVWSELLGVEAIGRDDDFFALGGHSLLVFSMLGRLPRRYRGEAGTLFENPVLRDFAAHLRVVASEETADRTVETVTIPAAYREAVEAAGKTGPGEAIEWRHILLTGATGFLGAHLLQEYMGTTGTRFILPVRGNEPLARLRETLAFYFDRDAAEAIAASSRLRVVPVDLADRNAADILARLGRIDCILHAAADTGHYGTYQTSHAVNAAATAALVRLAEESGAFFAHVSTVGAVNSALVTELDRDPGPPHINNYLRTKQLAETEIFSAMERGLAATVLRIGNIALNSQTLRSPRTFSHNALIRLTRLVALTGVYADTVPPVRYAFVDQTARAIRLLLERPAFTGAVHHVDNPYGVEYGDVFALAGRPRPRVVPTGDLRRILERLAAGSDPFLADVAREYLGRVRQHESEVAAGERVTATVLCDLTVARLKRIGFSWKKLSPGLAEEIVRNALKIS